MLYFECRELPIATSNNYKSFAVDLRNFNFKMKPTRHKTSMKTRINSAALVIIDFLTSRVEPICETESVIGHKMMKGTKSTQLLRHCKKSVKQSEVKQHIPAQVRRSNFSTQRLQCEDEELVGRQRQLPSPTYRA